MNLQTQPPEKKKRKKKTSKSSSSPPSFSLLPDETIENCLARVPRFYYPKLSLVSKSFHSLLSSPELYEARSRLGITQQCLYVCLSSHDPEGFRWITLSIDPNLITKKKSKKKKIAIGTLSVPIPSSNCATTASPTVVGSNIYIIGGHRARLSSVKFLDCRSHTWCNAPQMNVARQNPLSCLYDGKIYVIGGFRYLEELSPFAEVFDTKSQSWECLPDPGEEVEVCRYFYNGIFDGIVEIRGKIHLRHGCTLVAYYDPKQCKWGKKKAMFPWSKCVIDNVSYTFGKHRGTGTYNLWWRDMNGGGNKSKAVNGLYSFVNRYNTHGGSSDTRIILATFGGKLYVLWSWYLKKICCAEISLEKRDGDEIWGNVEWLHVVHTTSPSCYPLHCLAISV